MSIATDSGLLRAILERPHDDAARLIYADWLDDQGEAERAEFIRLQIRIATLETNCRCGRKNCRAAGGQHHNGPCAVDRERDVLPDGRSKQAFLRMREREFLSPANAADWCNLPYEDYGGVVGSPGDFYFRLGGGSQLIAKFRRGFVYEVRCRLVDWVGTECEACGGAKKRSYSFDGGGFAFTWCDQCHGTGRLNAHGPRIVLAQPVTRVVVAGGVIAHGALRWARKVAGLPPLP